MDINPEAQVVVVPVVEPAPVMDTILTWIGFDQQATRDCIRDEGFGSFEDLMSTKEKDIRDLAESYGRRTLGDGRVIFGLRRIQHLIGLIHWVQDFRRVGEEPSIASVNDAVQFREALDEAFDRADVRKIERISLTQSAKLPTRADARKVHQLIKSFLQTETAEQWIKPHIRRQSGRADMKALRDHYTGEGNTSRRIAVAERLRDSLHYKNEKSLQFSTFLDKMQKMFNIFEEENEIMTEQAKVRMLLRKVEHPELQCAINVLRVKAGMEGVTFTECANHLSAMVSELPDHQSSRKISAADSKGTTPKRLRGGGPRDAGTKRKGIHMPDGSIWTGYYSDWEKMSDTDKQTVMGTRKKNRAKGTTPGKKKGNDLKSQFAEMKRTLAAMQSKSSKNDDTDDTVDSSDLSENAGDAFGGRQKKKHKKE